MTEFFSVFLLQQPIIFVYILGIVISLVYRQRYPLSARLTAVALVVLLADSLVNSAWSGFLVPALPDQGWDYVMIGQVAVGLNFVRFIFQAFLWGLILIAIFGADNRKVEDDDLSVEHSWIKPFAQFITSFVFGLVFWLAVVISYSSTRSGLIENGWLVCLAPGWIMAYVFAKLMSKFFVAIGFTKTDFTGELTRAAATRDFRSPGCGWAIAGFLAPIIIFILFGLLVGI